jgi:hypothetical protein
MKLNSLILALVIGFFVLGCDKEDDKSIRFAQKEYKIDYGETIDLELEASGVSAPFEFTVEDKDVASVNEDGLLTAGLVGETTVLVNKDGESAECKVMVNPTVSFFIEPDLTWGASKQEVKDFEYNIRDLENEIDNILIYEPVFEYGVRNVLYLFESEALNSSMVLLENTETISGLAAEFLKERYHYVGYQDGTFMLYRGDVVAAISYNYDYGLYIMYLKYDGSDLKSVSAKTILQIVKEKTTSLPAPPPSFE